MKGENEAYVGEKGVPPGEPLAKGALIEPCSECSCCLDGSIQKEMVWELGQTCEADGNGTIMKKIQLPYFLPDILLEEIMQKFGILGRIIV